MGGDPTHIRVKSNAGAFSGSFWLAGWLFTLGFAGLPWWKALLGIVVWPYFLGVALK
jgi:hypothetical protein